MLEKYFKIPLRVLNPVLVIAVLIGLVLAATLIWRDIAMARENFDRDSKQIYESLTGKMNDISSMLSGVVALYNAVDIVDREQFSLFTDQMLKNYNYVSTIKLLTRVNGRDRKVFVSRLREEGYPHFDIREGDLQLPKDWKSATQRPQYFPVTNVEPFLPETVRELGYDYYSQPVFRQSIDTAIKTGRTAITGSVPLISGKQGYVFFKPVYAGRDSPVELNDRREQVVYIVAVAVPQEALFALGRQRPGLNVSVYRGLYSGSDTSNRIFHYQNPLASVHTVNSSSNLLEYTRMLDLDGQVLQLTIGSPMDISVVRTNRLFAILLIWLLLAAMMLFVINTHYLRLSDRAKSKREVIREKERAEVTLHSLAEAVITTDLDGNVDYMNPVAERLTGMTSLSAYGKPIEEVFRLVNETNDKASVNPVRKAIQNGLNQKSEGELALVHANGEHSSIDFSITPLLDYSNQVVGSVVVFQNVSTERMMSKLLAYQATHDDLTGLYNRREFERRLSRAIEAVHNHGDEFTLLYMDLDQFKIVNDTCGHVAGDLVLRQIAELLKPLVKEKEILARLGGDEFGALLESYNIEDAKLIAEEMRDVIRKYRFIWTKKVFEIGVSIGIVKIVPGMHTLSDVLSSADAACYLAKESGGNHVQVYQYDADDYKRRKDQISWIQRISQAFAENRFVLFAQKIQPLHSTHSDLEHYEILIRMIDDKGQMIVPQEYIAAAERYRTMRDIDRWVVRNAFIAIDEYIQRCSRDSSLPKREFSINLSGQSIGSESALGYIQDLLEEFATVTEFVVFEITETAAITNLESAQNFIRTLRNMGVRFSLDDFGTGVSSFNYLKNLQVDYLKIDGGFVREMDADPVDFAMVRSINHIGHVIGIKTIAEHAESSVICDRLREIGVDFAQGYWLHEPERLSNILLSKANA